MQMALLQLEDEGERAKLGVSRNERFVRIVLTKAIPDGMDPEPRYGRMVGGG